MNASSTGFIRAALSIPAAPPPAAPPPSATGQETSDDYSNVLFLAPGGRLRIIVCNGDMQWIAQTRRPLSNTHPRPWVAMAFCTSRAGLRRSLREYLQAGFPGLGSFIDTLPERFTKSGGQVN